MDILFAIYISILAISVTLGLINLVIWFNFRNKPEYLLFAISALAAGTIAYMDGIGIGITDPAKFLVWSRYYIIPLAVMLISIVWFIKNYFGTGRRWLAIFVTVLWSLCLIINFSTAHGLTFLSVESIETFSFFGIDTFNLPVAELNSFRFLADFADLFIFIFLVDATILVFKKGDKQKAINIGGSTILFFMLAAIITPLSDISTVTLPPVISVPFLFILIAMSVELLREVLTVPILRNKLFNKERNWASLLNELQLIVVKVNKEGVVDFINPFYLLKTGFSETDVLNKKWIPNFVTETESKRLTENFDIKAKLVPSHFQNRILTKKGKELEIFWTNIELYNNKGDISGVLAVGNDITEKENALIVITELKLQLEAENLSLKESQSISKTQEEIVTKSDAANYALKRARQVAEVDSSVLLEGETGVGKGLFANLIHNSGTRKNTAFIHVNCAAIPPDLIESELFGHEKGAFTGAQKHKKGRFELAHKGTLFLDEIGELPASLQPKLLRVLQDGKFEPLGSEKTVKVDVRIIAATNRDLYKEVQNGNFREDLFYRLNVFPITIPPLRKRKEDIPDLINLFVEQFRKKYNKKITKVSKNTYLSFTNYEWPGNIRELQNLIERAVITCNGDTLKTNGLVTNGTSKKSKSERDNGFVVMPLEEIERQHIQKTLEICNWQIHGEKGAAKLLEINPSTLRSRIKKLNIERNN